MYLNAFIEQSIPLEVRLTVTLDVFKFIFYRKLRWSYSWLTVTLDVFKYIKEKMGKSLKVRLTVTLDVFK